MNAVLQTRFFLSSKGQYMDNSKIQQINFVFKYE